jgi:hypothetical protein
MLSGARATPARASSTSESRITRRPALTLSSLIQRYLLGRVGEKMASRATQFRTVQAASLDRRAEPRHPVHITRATARTRHTKASAAILCEISTYGCRLISSAKHPPGERLWLRLNGDLPLAATVIWCADGRIGCRFDEPLPRELMRKLTIGELA